MKKLGKYVYNIFFWISRIFSISIFILCLSMVLHTKFVFSENYLCLITIFIKNVNKSNIFFLDFLHSIYTEASKFYEFKTYLFSIFCKNSQGIDLLLITLAIILILSIIIIKFVNKEYRYLLTVGIISSTIYLVTYSIFKLPVMLALTISTPIILTIIYFLNRICPIQKVIMLVPIIGEIFCIKSIIKYISNKTSDKILNIFLLITALILSNIICFLFPYKTNKDFENLIMNNWTYSIRTYHDKTIISGDRELIVVDKDDNVNHIENNKFTALQDFIINGNKKEIYFYNADDVLLILNMEDLEVIHEIHIVKEDFNCTRIYCNKDYSKIMFVKENGTTGFVDLSTFDIKYIKGIPEMRDGLTYNKYRDCFLISFHKKNKFLQEIDIENKKIRKIKADKYQGYIAMSEKNKEIYVAFHQQGRIGVYDAETMKLKRKIKSNYTVKNITYDEELNILIAPSYFTGYVDVFLMDGSDKLLTREFVGYDLREGCFDPQKENLYVCSHYGLFKKKINIRKLIEENSANKKVQ